MEFSLNSYSFILIIFSVITAVLASLVMIRLGTVVRWFGAMMLSIALWAASYGLMLASPELDQLMFWTKVEHIGIALLPTFWIIFIIKFVGKDNWLSPKIITALFIFPAVTLAMVWTNEYHHLHYKTTDIIHTAGYWSLSVEKGPWYVIHLTYFYALITAGFILAVNGYRHSDGIIRRQALIIIVGTIIPWIANILGVLEISIFQHIDPTSFAFLISCLIVVFGFLKVRLFDVVPLARNRVINAMQEGLLVIDSQHRIIDFNPKMLWIMGRSRGNITGTTFKGFGGSQEITDKLFNQNYEEDVDVEVHVGGVSRYFEVTCKTIRESGSTSGGRLFIFRDITQYMQDQRKLQTQAAELKELNGIKDRLLSIISHDVRGPLASLTQILDMNKDGDLDENEIRELLPRIGESLGYMTSFMENLLVWAKSQLEGENIQPVTFDLKEDIALNFNLFKSQIESKDIKVECSCNGPVLVFADQNMIRLAIRNILSNAVKFSQRKDVISCNISVKNGMAEVSISDTGVGISIENLDKIFSPYTFTTYGTENEQGTGLGLMLSKDFIEKNGGRIWAESELGQGSTFYFTVPISKVEEPHLQPHSHNC